MEKSTRILLDYRGRDKVIRTCGYLASFLAGICGKNAAQLSGCRTVLRLFDDIPILANSLSYGLGHAERDPIVRALQILTNVADQLYFPTEHLAFLGAHRVIPLPTSAFQTACICIWAMSLFFNILRCFRQIHLLRSKRRRIIRNSIETTLSEKEKTAIKELKIKESLTLLSLLKFSCDFMNAINWLPFHDFLWSGKIGPAKSGLLGVISSLIGLTEFCNQKF